MVARDKPFLPVIMRPFEPFFLLSVGFFPKALPPFGLRSYPSKPFAYQFSNL
jgi:hypothetical protein